jgi:hypothetical protein
VGKVGWSGVDVQVDVGLVGGPDLTVRVVCMPSSETGGERKVTSILVGTGPVMEEQLSDGLAPRGPCVEASLVWP